MNSKDIIERERPYIEEIANKYNYDSNITHLLYLMIPAFIIKYGVSKEKLILNTFKDIRKYIDRNTVQARRLFSLSDYGFYLFVFKLSASLVRALIPFLLEIKEPYAFIPVLVAFISEVITTHFAFFVIGSAILSPVWADAVAELNPDILRINSPHHPCELLV